MNKSSLRLRSTEVDQTVPIQAKLHPTGGWQGGGV